MSGFIFILCLLILAYIYGGYGLVLSALRRRLGVRKIALAENERPLVTLLLYVPEGQENLDQRLENLNALDWPEDKLDILVTLNGADAEIEKQIAAQKGRFPVTLVACSRQGKTTAQNQALAQARGDIVVFTDADSLFEPSFLTALLAPFADPSVGCTTGRLGEIDAEGNKVPPAGLIRRYEQHLRACESDLGWLGSASAACMAVRRTLCGSMPAFASDEAYLPLSVLAAGQRVVFCADALAYETPETDPARAYAALVRATMRGFAALRFFPQLLDFKKARGQAFILASHKAARWIGGPVLAVMTLASLPMLLTGGLTTLAAVIYLALLSYGFIGLKEGRGGRLSEGFAGGLSRFLLMQSAYSVGLWKSARLLARQK